MKIISALKRLFSFPLNLFRCIINRNSVVYQSSAIPEMLESQAEGYTDKPFYYTGEQIKFYLKSPEKKGVLVISRIIAPYTYEEVKVVDFIGMVQKIRINAAQAGCNWQVCATVYISDFFDPGYYVARIQNDPEDRIITFIIGSNSIKDIAVLAPVTAWAAYNPYGGKSFDKNSLDKNPVHYLSTNRPNTAIGYNRNGNIHDIHVEANIFNWFSSQYNVNVFPDFFLEENSILISRHKMVVLAYRCEFFSDMMNMNLREIILKTKRSLISMGAKHMHWKVKWHEEYTLLECRKDGSFFSGTMNFGGLWRNTLLAEDQLLGVRYTKSGAGSYAGYKSLLPEHWLFENTNLSKGDLFGESGIHGTGLSGAETDKVSVSTKKQVSVIAKGMNPENGGADFTIKVLSEKHAVLSTGSSNSGAGLGTDPVFTKIITNFIDRYL